MRRSAPVDDLATITTLRSRRCAASAIRPDAWRDAARAAGRPLRPAILWNDGRSHADAASSSALSVAHGHRRQFWRCPVHRAKAALVARQ